MRGSVFRYLCREESLETARRMNAPMVKKYAMYYSLISLIVTPQTLIIPDARAQI